MKEKQYLKTFLILLPFAIIAGFMNYLQLDQYGITDIVKYDYRTYFNIFSWLGLIILVVELFLPIVYLKEKIQLKLKK